MRKMKRLLSLLLVTAALASLLVLPGQAAFTDVRDPAVAEAAEALRVMGVLDGTGNGAFSPSGTLTRAQFAKIIVLCMGLKDEVAAYETRTIFSDVRSHWAKGYINLAATHTVDGGETGYRLIAGVGDGTFRPDRAITYGEAVTILLRALGYGAEAGRSWPHSAVSTAASIGLADGLPAIAAGGTINRGQTAILFRNFLLTETKEGGGMFISGKYTVQEKVILLSADSDGVTTTAGNDKEPGAAIKPLNDLPSAALVGRRGTLVLDKKTGKFVTFLPDKSTRVTATVSANATARAVTITGGHTYSIDSKTPVWNGDTQSTFGESFSAITTGKTVTLYLDEGGSVNYVYLGSTAATGNAMVAKNKVTGNPFTSLTNGSTNFSIYKNGAAASVSDLRQYDVAVYDSVANSLRVSDLRITGILENASPNLQTPDTITVMGKKFNVLDCAYSDLHQFKLGDMITLLLTENGVAVAGALEPATLRATAVGYYGGGNSIALLGSDLVLEGLTFSNSESSLKTLEGQIVNISSYQRGKVSISRVSGSNAPGNFNVAARKVGTLSLAPNVQVYDRVGNGPLKEIDLADLTQTSISSSRIDFVHRDYANRVDVLVFNDVSGDCYTYGMLNYGQEERQASSLSGSSSSKDEDNGKYYVNVLSVTNGQGTTETVNCTAVVRNGAMGGVVIRTSGETPELVSVITLQSVSNATRNQLDAASMTFTTNSMILPISEDVQCYIKDLKGTGAEWLSGDQYENRLPYTLGFSEKFTVYYDRAPEEGGKVRVIVAE